MRRLSLHNHGPRLLYRKVLVFLIRNPYKKNVDLGKNHIRRVFRVTYFLMFEPLPVMDHSELVAAVKRRFTPLFVLENVDSPNKLKIECFMEIEYIITI